MTRFPSLLGRYDDGSDVFPNLVEFELARPSPPILRAMKDVRCTINESMSSTVQGDFCDGLILAADTLHRRTRGKKYSRKIVMITDAEHEVEVNGEQLQCVLDGLGNMDVELIVVGIGFEEGISIPVEDEDSGDHVDIDEKPEAVVSIPDGVDNVDMIEEEGNPDDVMGVAVKQESDMNMAQLIKRENEKLLLSIAREARGCVLAANGANIAEVLQAKLPYLAGMTKSVSKKIDFRVAPGLTVAAKTAKLTSKQTLPYTIKEAYEFDPETGEVCRDGNGELMTSPVRAITIHYDDDGNEVPYDKRTDAFRYGCDLIPVGKMDMLGINAAFAGPPNIEMIGYVDRRVVESSNLLMGPAYALTGGDSRKSRTAIAALSQAMEETGKVGFCRVVRMRNGEPRVGALFPKIEGCDDGSLGSETRGKGGRYLVLLELPFADDLQHILPPPVHLDYHGDYKDEAVCDDLIDSMMLPDDEFLSEEVSFPALKAHHRMVAHFAMNPLNAQDEMNKEGLAEGSILEASQAKPLCDSDVLKSLSKHASEQIDAFVDTFPLVEHRPEDDKKPKYWGDGILN